MTSPQTARCVVLFDIDGTLVSGTIPGSSAGVRAMDRASIAVAGQPSAFRGADYAGRTDVEIARMLLADAGVTDVTRRQIDALLDHYVDALAQEIGALPFKALGDARAAVTQLRERGALVGLGTGNVRRGGFLKLKSAGIADLFDEWVGGFGDDGETRGEVLEAGVRTLDPSRTLPVVIVGDTPRDVAAATLIGAFSVAVPFGQHDRRSLIDAGATVVVDHIDETLADVVFDLVARYVQAGG